MAKLTAQNFYLIRQTDAGSAADGRHVFDLPPVPLLDGDSRSPFARYLSESAYTGQPEFIKYVKPPSPEPQGVNLTRGVGLVEQICDSEDYFVGLSKAHYSRFEKEFRGALEHLHPVNLYRHPGQRSGKVRARDYWVGTLKWRNIVVHWCDFPNSKFDLVDFSDFHRHGTRVMRGKVELDTPYPLIESACCFESLAEFKESSRAVANNFQSYVPTHLSMKVEGVPALFQFDINQILIRGDIAEALRGYTKPGALCPYQPVQVFQAATS